LLLHHFFFFSSRRRHTSFSRDWSSDVCSSDLLNYCFLAYPIRSFWNGDTSSRLIDCCCGGFVAPPTGSSALLPNKPFLSALSIHASFCSGVKPSGIMSRSSSGKFSRRAFSISVIIASNSLARLSALLYLACVSSNSLEVSL